MLLRLISALSPRLMTEHLVILVVNECYRRVLLLLLSRQEPFPHVMCLTVSSKVSLEITHSLANQLRTEQAN